MAKKMLIDATHAEETRVVVLDGNRLEEFDYESINKKQLAGNIYLAKVMRVEPSLQAAFVDYGGNRHGFLAFNEIHPDYYQIPKADRDALIAAQAREDAESDEDEDERPKPRRGSSRSGKSDSNDRRRGSRRGGRSRRGGGQRSGVKRTRDGEIVEREFRIAGGVKVRLTRPDDGTEHEFKLDDGTPVSLARYTDGPPKTMASATDFDEKVSADADDVADAPEEVGGGDARDEIQPRKPRLRDYKIQDVIKKRQILLIQVVKEERGSKGAAVTTYLSLAGRYCVLMPNTARGGGISRKITNAADRKKLKEIAGELDVPKGMGLIIRTAGAERTRAEIKRDYEYLLRQWEAVRDLTLESFAPALVYEEGSLIKRSIRDLYTKDIEEIQVEGEDGYREAKDYMKMLTPSHAKNVQPYRDQTPLFIRHQVENALAAMFNPTVQLKSGGYIVIGITEALVAIDVNSGRSTRESSIEDTAVKTNLEAAEEVARQLRLRDLAGLIVIDFIDMDRSANNRAVEKRLKEKLASDRARLQIGRISSFGLLEMSRQRLRPGMLEASTKPCPHCHGEGIVRSDESLALTILRDVEEEGVRQRSAVIVVQAPVDIANFLLNQKRDRILSIEERYNLRVAIEGDVHLISPVYKIERMKEDDAPESLRRQRTAVTAQSEYMGDEDEDDVIDGVEYAEENRKESDEADSGEKPGRRGSRGGRRKQQKPSKSDPLPVIDLDKDEAETADAPFQFGDDAEARPGGKGNRRRGKRGGRGRSQRGKLGDREMAEAAASSMLSGRDALDDALPQLFADAVPAPQPEPANELPPEPEQAPVAEEATRKLETVGNVVEAPAEAEHDAVVQVAETGAPESTPEPEPAPTATFERPEPTPEKKGPKKRGWWSRSKSAS